MHFFEFEMSIVYKRAQSSHIYSHTSVTFKNFKAPEKELFLKMILKAIFGLCMVTFSRAFPQAPFQTTTLAPLEPGCRYEKIEVQDVVHKEVLEEKCHDLKK